MSEVTEIEECPRSLDTMLMSTPAASHSHPAAVPSGRGMSAPGNGSPGEADLLE